MGISVVDNKAMQSAQDKDLEMGHGTQRTSTKPLGLIMLYLLGFVLIFVGIGQQYGRLDIFPQSLLFSYSGLALAALGLVLTLPFWAWTIRTCDKLLSNISL